MTDFGAVKQLVNKAYGKGKDKVLDEVERLKSYTGFGYQKRAIWAERLKTIVDEESTSILSDHQALGRRLVQEGLDELLCYKILLMTRVTGFEQLINGNASCKQVDLDRFISNAIDETGFNRNEVLGLTSDLCFSAGIDVFYKESAVTSAQVESHIGTLLPRCIYEEELNKVAAAINNRGVKGLDTATFDRLVQLARIRIPAAECMLGQYMLDHCEERELFQEAKALSVRLDYEKEALQYLRRAAYAGDMNAAARLGDYYFAKEGPDDWNKAYEYYTGYGAIALTPARKKNLITILSQKKINRKIIVASIALFAVMLVSVFVAPMIGLYEPKLFWGIVALVVNAGVLVTVVLHNSIASYGRLYFLPLAMLCVWFCYLIIRIAY